jgi:hypothetical protein
MLDVLPPSEDVALLREVVEPRPRVAGQPLHGDAHAAWVTASMMTALPRRPDLAGAVQRRLRQLGG